MSDAIPPVIQILLAEDFDGIHTGPALRRRLKPLLADLRRQADWTMANHTYVDEGEPSSSSPEFTLRPSGGLDPFSIEVCAGIRCRFNAAEQFARTLCLLADRVVLPDLFTPYFLEDADLTVGDAGHLMQYMVVLGRLQPLVNAGVVQFGTPVFDVFNTDQQRKALDQLVDDMLPEVQSALTFEPSRDGVDVMSGRLVDPPLTWRYKWDRDGPAQSHAELGRRGFRRMLREHVETLLGDMLSARQLGGVLASGSRLGLLALKRTEAAAIAPNEVEQWEALRTVRLPWVDHLSASEILRLREEAAAALPRLRSLVAQKLAAPGNNEQQLKQLLAELRDQAIEVKAELDNLKWYRERGFRTLSGTLGISVAVYGLAAGFVTPAVALGSLLSMLGIVHSAERQDERDHAKIISKPGYVLMKARELAHHHG